MFILYAFMVDLLVGDPRWLPHPVSAIARWAKLLEGTTKQTQLAGVAVWLAVVSATCAVVWLTCRFLPAPWTATYWVYCFLATRSLDDHAMAVIRPLEAKNQTQSRLAVSMIVGRDTADLDEEGVTRAVLETVAENLNDGVVAPLFWLAIGGPVAMAGYKAINTLDSMFGYKNDKYLHFGWCSARMDDFASYIPARLTAALIWLVAALTPGLDAARSIAITFRDAHLQPSPNSGYPEAAAAGALGIRLGGLNHYSGVPSQKAFLGDQTKPLTWRAYTQLRLILYAVSTLAVLMAAGAQVWR